MTTGSENGKSQTPDEMRQKGSLFRSTTETLRQLILNGALPPGQRIKERELCARLNVSRTPVREAIKALIQEGLLQSLPNRSAVPTGFDLEEVQALAVVVAEIERVAVELACDSASSADLEGIAAAHHDMVIHHVRNNMAEYFRANKEFHRRIILSTRNSVLLWVWDLLSTRVDRARYASNLQPERWPLAIKEHGAILEALIARDAPNAGALMRSHVHNGLSVVIARLSKASVAARVDGIVEG